MPDTTQNPLSMLSASQAYLNANPDAQAEYERFSAEDPSKWTPESYAAYHYLNYGLQEGRAGAEGLSTIGSHLVDQIMASSDPSQWEGQGRGSALQNAQDMAGILASAGITDIKDFGQLPKYQKLETQTGPDGNPVYGTIDARWVGSDNGDYEYTFTPVDPSQVVMKDGVPMMDTGDITYGNTATGQVLGKTYGERQVGNAFGGTYAGEGNTAYRVEFDSEGAPHFYTTEASSSSTQDFAPLIAVAPIVLNLAFPGLGNAIGAVLSSSMGLGLGTAACTALGNTIVGTVLNGGDIGKAAISAISSYAGSTVANSDAVSGFLKDNKITGILATSIKDAAGGAAAAIVRGDDPVTAALASGGGRLISSTVLTGLDKTGLSDSLTPAQDKALSSGVTAFTNAKLSGASTTDALISGATAAVSATTTKPGSGSKVPVETLTPTYRPYDAIEPSESGATSDSVYSPNELDVPETNTSTSAALPVDAGATSTSGALDSVAADNSAADTVTVVGGADSLYTGLPIVSSGAADSPEAGLPTDTVEVVAEPTCAAGYHYDAALKRCVPDDTVEVTTEPTCPVGYHYDAALKQCVPDDTVEVAGEKTDTTTDNTSTSTTTDNTTTDNTTTDTTTDTTCPIGEKWNPVTQKCEVSVTQIDDSFSLSDLLPSASNTSNTTSVSGALPGNITAPSLAAGAAGPQEKILQDLKQLSPGFSGDYPQMASIDPGLLQILTSRNAAAPGAAAPQDFGAALSATSPAGMNATGATGLGLLSGAKSLSPFAKGGTTSGASGALPVSEHVPEFITGKTGNYVQGAGDGQSDDIPAMLADGEYVFDADIVSALGNGSNKAGARILDKMRQEIRKHKRSAPPGKIPPPAKSPLEYMKG